MKKNIDKYLYLNNIKIDLLKGFYSYQGNFLETIPFDVHIDKPVNKGKKMKLDVKQNNL